MVPGEWVVMKMLNVVLKLLFSLLILGFIFYQVGFNLLIESVISTPYWIWVMLVFYLFLSMVISTYCYKVLLEGIGKKISFGKLFAYHALTWAGSRFLFGKFSEVSILYFFKKESVGYGPGMSVFVVDKIVTLVLFTLLSAVGLFLVLDYILPTVQILLLVWLAGVTFFLLSVHPKSRRVIKKYILGKYAAKFKDYSKTMKGLLMNKRTSVYRNFLLTLLRILNAGIFMWVVFYSLGYSLNLASVILIHTMALTVSMLPLTLSGLGVREGVGIFLFSKIGVDVITAGTVYIIFRIVAYLFALLIIVISFFTVNWKNYSLREVLND